MIGGDAAARHLREAGRFRTLDESEATLALNRFQSQCAVGIHSRENHTDGAILLVGRERAKEEVDGPRRRFMRTILEPEDSALQRDLSVGWKKVDVIRLGPCAVLNDDSAHRALARDDLGQKASGIGGEVRDNDEGHAGVRGKMLKKF